MYSGKYITILNPQTKQSVPFRFGEGGELVIASTSPFDRDDNCYVVVGNVFYEHSMDISDFIKLQARKEN